MTLYIARFGELTPSQPACGVFCCQHGNQPLNEYAFSYQYAGRLWAISVLAENENDAVERVKAMSQAHYEGEIIQSEDAGDELIACLSPNYH